jgi:hypothetical protein
MNKEDLVPFADPNPERPRTYMGKLHPQPPFVWRPRMTEQQRAEQEAHIKKHNLPF